MSLDPLAAREIFHLELLRAFSRVVKPSLFSLKGGSNLRFFFGSNRYSEDMDVDIAGIPVHELQEKTLKILTARSLLETLRTFGIERVAPPDLAVAKQIETVQRFKIHLFTSAGLDLFTKIEFSRRGLETPFRPEAVASPILGKYRMGPLIVPHYLAAAAIRQKVRALASRKQVEARDIFDLYTLSTRSEANDPETWKPIDAAHLAQARERLFLVSHTEYRDKVIPFLAPEDQEGHESETFWDEIRLRVEELLARGSRTGKEARKGGKP
jgi:predicted nucleotidyltransferase component of viral defense system